MKPTVRVSIGGLAFTLEEDAYQVLDNYLQALRNHFADNSESEEIISDIESRLSELLQMRMGSNDTVLSLNDTQDVIKTMGNPKDFEDPADNSINTGNTAGGNHSKANPDFEKKLFRDMDNKIIGGVCSGIGHYFRVDPTAIRLIFAGVFLLLFFVGYRMPTSLSVIVIYVILWIVMPAAKTFKQKISMTGSDPSIVNIEERDQAAPRKYKGSSINSVLGVLLNIVVGFIAMITFFFLIAMIVAGVWLYFDTDILGISNYMLMLGYDTWDFKTSLFLASILPVIGLFILLIKILRRSSFTSGSFVSFIICFIIWLGSVFYLGNKGFKFAYSHQSEKSVTEIIPQNVKSDTLFVRLGTSYKDKRYLPQNWKFIYKGDKWKDRAVSILPNVKVEKDDSLTDYKIEIRKHAFGYDRTSAKRNAEQLKLDYSLYDSIFTINPTWYDKDNRWDLETFDIVITAPDNKKVIIEDDLDKSYHNYSINIYGYNHHGYYRNFVFD